MAQLYRTLTGQSTKSATSTNPAAPAASDKPNQLVATVTNPQNPYKGRLNHLSSEENERLAQFKEKLRDQNWWTPDGVNGKPSHDDATLLRYLRARKFVVEDAIGQFTDTEKWMKENKVEDLYQTIDVEFYEKARKMYPQWTGRRDKRGIPIYVYEIRELDSKNVSKYQKESETFKAKLPYHKTLSVAPKLLPLFALYQNLLSFVLPLCSTLERPNPEIPVTNSTNIVDISGVGLGQFWNLKQHMQDASVLATAHYPETLDRIFIIGAPAFFPTVWGWIKRWFDPVTVSKIFILGKHEVKPTLESFMDPSNFPTKYGGTLEWSWGDLPDLGPQELAAVEADGSKGWIEGPCMWLKGKRIVVGTANGQARTPETEVNALKPVVFAADGSENPVHQDTKISSETTVAPSANGEAQESSSTPKDQVVPAAVGGGVIAAEQPPSSSRVTKSQADSSLNVHKSPMGDSQVHIPEAQPEPQPQVAEYISQSTTKSDEKSAPTTAQSKATTETAAAATAPTAAAAVEEKTTPSPAATQSPPPGHTQPGPLSKHNVEVTKLVVSKMEGESVSTLPAKSGAEGELSHPELTLASDAGKGLAVETEKLDLANDQNGRPPIERFVTAAEIK